MPLSLAIKKVDFILEQDFRDKAYQAYLHSFADCSFEEFLRRCRPEKLRPSKEILAEMDKIFEGR